MGLFNVTGGLSQATWDQCSPARDICVLISISFWQLPQRSLRQRKAYDTLSERWPYDSEPLCDADKTTDEECAAVVPVCRIPVGVDW